MIDKQTIKFLQQLKKNNNRDWFQAHKADYEAARENVIDNVAQVIQGIGRFDENVIGMDAKKCMFRIYRDIRFSKDKSPYKTHLSARMHLQGSQSGVAGYYFHIEPGNTILAGGIYHPEPKDLLAIRHYISDYPGQFKSIVNKKDFKDTFGSLWGETLKTAPRGFDKDHELVDFLKMKTFIMTYNVPATDLQKKDFVRHAVGIYKKMLPFNNWVNEALEAAR